MEALVFCFFLCVFFFCHSTTIKCLKIWIIIFFFIVLYIPFLCICTGGVCIHFYHWIHIVVLSIISPFCHWWPLRPKTQLIQHCHVKQLGDIFESKITYKLSFLHYKNGQLNLGVNILVYALKHHQSTEMWPRPLLNISAWNWMYT